jgi:uncharacterized membrane protein YidH (DUF202 family)
LIPGTERAVVNQQTEGPDAVAPPLDRTSMAKLRTQLSLDRTTLAWIRAALTMATFGFALVAFFPHTAGEIAYRTDRVPS